MTKQQLLQKVSPSDIYLHYLQLNKFPVGNISSPFSDDKKPSFKLYKNGTYKCWSTGNQGDVFQFVADLHKLNCKKDFNTVIDKIATDLKIINGKPVTLSRTLSEVEVMSKGQTSNITVAQKTQPITASLLLQEKVAEGRMRLGEAFSVETTDLTPLHFNYYHQFGVSLKY